MPVPLAIGSEPPPDGQTVIDGVSFDEAINAGVLTPDNTAAQRLVVDAWRWFSSLG